MSSSRVSRDCNQETPAGNHLVTPRAAIAISSWLRRLSVWKVRVGDAAEARDWLRLADFRFPREKSRM
jgi:hypothetical protein